MPVEKRVRFLGFLWSLVYILTLILLSHTLSDLLFTAGADGYQPSEGLENDSGMMTKTVTITLTAAAGYMFLVIGLMVWCRYRRRKRKQAYLTANPEGILRKFSPSSNFTLMQSNMKKKVVI